MGDPKRITRKYSTPIHPWQKERIDEEKALLQEYGLKNKKEVWKMNSVLKRFKSIAKNLIPRRDNQATIEEKQLLDKLRRYGLLTQNGGIEEVLGLTVRDVCDRRLQTIVHRRRLSKSVKQARQFVTHNHILIGQTKVTSPEYLVSLEEEQHLTFAPNSPLVSEDHPERFKEEIKEVAESPIIKKKHRKEEKAEEAAKSEAAPKETEKKVAE